jgi:hypothetical protein
VLADHGDCVVADEGRAAGQRLVEQRAERVEIGARRHLAAHRLLGRHVGRRPDHRAVLRHARAVERHREAEVAELDSAVGGEPHVPGLHVAVHDAVRVRVGERSAELLGDGQRLVDGEPVSLRLREALLEIAARHVLADEVDALALFDNVMHGHDVRVVAEPPHRLGLAPHAHEVEAFALDERDRDLAAEPRVAREVHALLGAFAEQALELVAAARERPRLRARARCSGGFAARLRERGPALVAEALPAQVLRSARNAGNFRGERLRALAAEPGRLRILLAAARTLHAASP